MRIAALSRTRLLRALLAWLVLEVAAAAQVRRPEGSLLLSWLRAAAAPIAAAARGTVDAGRDVAWGLGEGWRLIHENTRLRTQLQEARARNLLLQQAAAVRGEADRLLLVYPSLADRALPAAVTMRNPATGMMRLAAGWLDGVHRDAPVLAADGLVGRVVRVEPHASWVELITRATAAVAVRVEGTPIEGLAAGTGGGDLAVEYLPRRAGVLRGNLLVTSGADGIYPAGIPVARVTGVRESPGTFLAVRAAPTVTLASVRVCLVVRGWPRPAGAPGTP